MLEPLDRTSRRIIGVLVEKQFTTPQQYPLSLNALVSGCNQRSNRDPVLHLQDFEVEGALKSLLISGWVTEVRGAGSRVIKWKHRADDKLATTEAELTVMTEFFLRGAQQPGELRTRCNRMHPFHDVSDVDEALQNLAQRGLVRKLVKRVGERIPRWDHLLYPGSEVPGDESGFTEPTKPVHAVVGPIGEPQALPAAPSAPPPPASCAPAADEDDIEDRVGELERRLEELSRRIARLEGGTDEAISGLHD